MIRYYRRSHGVIIVYDISEKESFFNIGRWLEEIENNCGEINKILGKLVFQKHSLNLY